MKGIILGKEEREYVQNGTAEKKIARVLHVVWDLPRRVEDGLTGRRVESVYVPFAINDVEPGCYCNFEYDLRATARGTMARLVDVEVLGTANVLLEVPAR